MAPKWMVGKIDRAKAEAFCAPYEDGKFVVREHDKAGQYVLCVVFRGKPTHHLISKNGDGDFTINKKTYGSSTTDLATLIAHFETKKPGWPVPLDKPCGKAGSVRKSSGGGGGGGNAWLHGAISRQQSEDFLMAGGTLDASNDGRFLIRTRDESGKEWVLALVFRGKATHHLMSTNESGNITVNKKVYGAGTTDIGALVAELSGAVKPAGWPVKLKEGVDKNGVVFSMSDQPAARKSSSGSSTGSLKRGSSKKGSRKGSRKGSMKSSPPWLHPKMTNPEAAAKFDGKKDEGLFMVRKHAEKVYALSVIFRGKLSHHLLSCPAGGSSKIGKGQMETGISGGKVLSKTIEFLREARPQCKWPVALKDHIAKAGAAAAEVAVAPVISEDAPSAATPAAATPTPTPTVDPAVAEAARKKVEADAAIAAAAAAQQQKAAAESMRQAAAAEDNRVTGFYQLKNPFPKAEGGYVPSGPGADLLAEARHLARATATTLSSDVRSKFGVGQPLKLFGVNAGSSSTDDWEPEMEDTSDGTGTAPLHMNMMSNPYMAPVGLLGTGGGMEKLAVVQRKVRDIQMTTKQLDDRSTTLEAQMATANERLTGEVQNLRSKTEYLERKIALLENLLITKSDTEGGDSIVTLTDIRMLTMKKGMGGMAAKPTKADLARTTMLGKIRLMKDATFADVRRLIIEEFDGEETPDDFKFYTIDDQESQLLPIHQKQEGRVPVDASVVYMVPQVRNDPRSNPNPYLN